MTLAGPAAFIALELGWIIAEEGRQPWVVYGILRTSDAVNPAQWMNVSFLIFSCIYLLLGTTLIVLLLMLARRPKPPQIWSELVTEEEHSEKEEVGTL